LHSRAISWRSQRETDRVGALAASVAFLGKHEYVAELDPSVLASRQTAEREEAVGEEPVDELAGYTQEVGCASGCDFLVGAKDHHLFALGHVLEYLAYRCAELARRVRLGREPSRACPRVGI
jgi:hypothetical protein